MASAICDGVCTRTTPPAAQAASTTSDDDTSDAVCEEA